MPWFKDTILTEEIEKVLNGPTDNKVHLAKVSQDTNFGPFFVGTTPVLVMGPSRHTFRASIHGPKECRGNFILTALTSEPVPPLDIGSEVIIFFNLDKSASVAKAAIKHIYLPQIEVTSVDPRAHTRYRTLLEANFTGIHPAVFNNLKTSKYTIKRTIEYQGESQFSTPKNVNEQLIEIPDKVLDPRSAMPEGSYRALVTDISLGGCCLMIPPTMPTDTLEKNFIVFIQLNLPAIDQALPINTFAVIRAIRRGPQSTTLHCMFMDPLPNEIFVI